MREALFLICRTLVLALALGLAGPPTLHAQEDDDGVAAGQSVDLPRSGGEEASEAGNDPGDEARYEESQAPGETEASSDAAGGEATEGAQGDVSGDQTATSSAGGGFAGSDGSAAGPGQASSAPGARGPADPAETASAPASAGQRPGPFDRPPLALGLALAAAATAGGALLAAKLLMPWPRPRVSCACEVSPPSLPGGSPMLHPPDLEVRAETICGAPSLAGELAIEQGSIRDG